MWLLLLLISGGALLMSGILAGVVRSIQKVYGYSDPLLFGDPEKNYDLGLLPVFILKTGVFSSIGVWVSLLIRFGDSVGVTILSGIGIGTLLALAHISLVRLLQRFRRIGFEIIGILAGMIVGIVIGLMGTRLIGLYGEEMVGFGIFVLVSIAIGGLVGGANGIRIGEIFPDKIYKAIICEIDSGGILTGICGTLFFRAQIKAFGGIPDFFDILMFTVGSTIVGCLLSGCVIIAHFVVLLFRRIISSNISHFLISLTTPTRKTTQSFSMKLLIFVIMIGCIVVPIISIMAGIHHILTPSFGWVSIFGGRGPDEAHSIQTTSDGGYILAGETTKGKSYYDAWICKLDAQGQQVWERTFGNAKSNDSARIIRTTPDGGYIVAGTTEGAGGQDAWVFKLDAQGQPIWEHTFGGKIYDYTYDLQMSLDGDYLVAGSLGGKAWVFKIDGQGHQVWERTFDGETYALQITSDGSCIVAGSIRLKGAGDRQNSWVFKLDAQGQQVWERTFDKDKNNDSALVIQSTPDGGYIVAGETKGDIWIFKLNAQGQQVWERILDKSYSDEVFAIQLTLDGGYIVAGNIRSKVAAGINSWMHLRNTWILILDTQGQPVKEYTFDSDDWFPINLYTQSERMWVSIFTVSNMFVKEYYMFRSEIRKIGYPLGYPLNGQDNLIYDIQTTQDGGFVMAGYFVVKYDKNEIKRDRDAWIVKFKPKDLWKE